MRLIYLKAEQNAEVPGRPVVEGVNQIHASVSRLLQSGLCVWLRYVNCQLWLFITVFPLGKKANKSLIQTRHLTKQD